MRRRRATSCLGSWKALQERASYFLASRLAGWMRRDRVAGQSCIKVRDTPARPQARFLATGKCTFHLGFGLDSVFLGRDYPPKAPVFPSARLTRRYFVV